LTGNPHYQSLEKTVLMVIDPSICNKDANRDLGDVDVNRIDILSEEVEKTLNRTGPIDQENKWE